MEGRGRLVVLVSGGGTNLQAVLDATLDDALDAQVVAVVSNRADAFALDRARTAGVPALAVELRPGEERTDYDARLADVVAAFDPDIVVLAGWMRILTMSFLGRFPGRVLNLHPALAGELPGTRAIERAYDEFLAGARTSSGVMVHLVPDEGVDAGPVVDAVAVHIHPTDSFDDFADRMHAAERELLVRSIARTLHDLPHPTEASA